MTSMPRSKSSSASEGVIPKPAAAFSQLAMTRSTACCRRSSGRRSFTIARPGRPKMSPMKRIFKVRWYHAKKGAGRAPANGNRLLAGDFSGFEEIVISGRIQNYVPNPAGVHEHVIEVPQVDRWHILRQNLLHFGIEFLARILISFALRFVDQGIDPRIGVKTPVAPRWWKVARVKNGVKNVGIFDPAGPAQ